MAFVELSAIYKTFPSPAGKSAADVHAVRDVSLSVEQGEMIALLGESGSGKTTLLRCLAGLETPDDGEITIDGTLVFSNSRGVNLSPLKRNLGMIFQSYALWPHMTVFQNVVYPLVRRGVPAKERQTKVNRILELVGCADFDKRYPHQLSGGQQQRVALARALVYEPRLVLFDEPLSNLDASLREQLRYYIREIKRTIGFTGVYVTHDQTEAFFIGDKVAILSSGKLLQHGRPEDVYTNPVTPAVASFLGASNLLRGRLVQNDGTGCWSFVADDVGTLDVTTSVRRGIPSNIEGLFMFRPDEAVLEPSGGHGIPGKVIDRVELGSYREYLVELRVGTPWRCRVPRTSPGFAIGDHVCVIPSSEMAIVFEEGKTE